MKTFFDVFLVLCFSFLIFSFGFAEGYKEALLTIDEIIVYTQKNPFSE